MPLTKPLTLARKAKSLDSVMLKTAAQKGGGAKCFSHVEGGRKTFYPVLRGRGAQQVLDPRFSHFVALPLPVINDQSLKRKEISPSSMLKYIACRYTKLKENHLMAFNEGNCNHFQPTIFNLCGLCMNLGGHGMINSLRYIVFLLHWRGP